MLRQCYICWMKSISQRELRNESGEILRRVSSGESFRVTNRGVPVATISPMHSDDLDALTLRQGSQHMVFDKGIKLARTNKMTTDRALSELRGHR